MARSEQENASRLGLRRLVRLVSSCEKLAGSLELERDVVFVKGSVLVLKGGEKVLEFSGTPTQAVEFYQKQITGSLELFALEVRLGFACLSPEPKPAPKEAKAAK